MREFKLLVKALINAFEMKEEDALALAEIVKRIFNGKKEIEDNSISKEVRALFYELENIKLLRVRREEHKESMQRKYYWSLNRDALEKIANSKESDRVSELYRTLPRRAWLKGKFTD